MGEGRREGERGREGEGEEVGGGWLEQGEEGCVLCEVWSEAGMLLRALGLFNRFLSVEK